MTLQEALLWITDIFESPSDSIQPGTRKDEIKGWDSLGTLALMAKLDEDFNIILAEEELAELKEIEDILKIFRAHGHLE